MTSVKMAMEIEKESTLFGDLSQIEKQTSRISKQLIEDIQIIKRLQLDFNGLEKQAKFAAEDSKAKLSIQVHVFEEKIKNYLFIQKAECTRFANQINQIIVNHKQINSHLIVLKDRFEEFQKNVGL